MTAQPGKSAHPYYASRVTRGALLDFAQAVGTPIIYGPAYPGGPETRPDVNPLNAIELSRLIQLAARRQVHDYIRAAREAEVTWHEIGTALRLVPSDGQLFGNTAAARAGFAFAAREQDAAHTRRHGPSVTWHCNSCERNITDRGTCHDPAVDESGHADDCGRLARTTAVLPPEWQLREPGRELDREAGQ